MRNQKHPELPGCAPVPLRYKETPVTNGDGAALTMCQACEGTGTLCTATRTTFHKLTGEPTKETASFNGAKRDKFKRGGVGSSFHALPRLQGRRVNSGWESVVA